MTKHFADLHCHPTLYGFNRVRNTPAESDPERFTPWHVPTSDTSAMDEGKRANAYSQTDFAKMSLGGLRLVFASLTPIEVGFFRGSPDGVQDTSFWWEAMSLASGATAVKSAVALLQKGPQAALRDLTGILRNDGPARKLLQRIFLGYDLERFRFMVSEDFDYWAEFLREYDYLKASDGEPGGTDVSLPGGGQIRGEGVYHLIDSAEKIPAALKKGEAAVVLTIEGGHVFTIGPDQRRVSESLIFERIEALKTLAHPLFFITLAHHFDNGVCGHARSLPGAANLVMDQRERMNEGFEAEGDLGLRVTRALLDLDEDLKDLGGRRVLIDAKHLSPRCRKVYYDTIIDPYNARANAGQIQKPPIPVIISHSGYSGVDSLDTIIAHEDLEDADWHLGPWNAWGINACDDDVRAVHRSGGLIGLCFDQRIVGLRPGDKTPPENLPAVLSQQILDMIDVIMLDDRLTDEAKRTAWDCLCIGSDFDGLIDPVSCYATALSLPEFADDLRAHLTRVAHTRQIAAIGVDELVEKICWRNAFDFVMKHFPTP